MHLQNYTQFFRRIDRLIFFLAINLIAGFSLFGQSINISPGGHSLTTTSTDPSVDLTIPENPMIQSIYFTLVGGDGGDGQGKIGPSVYLTQGGEGAEVEMEILIGTGEGEIPPGSVLRFVEGKKGSTNSRPDPSFKYGGGGGGSAVLFKAPGDSGWQLLAVAGGGGGASGYRDGQGGRISENGGNNNGNAAAGGIDGKGGKSSEGAGGGGADSDGGNVECSNLGDIINPTGGGGAGGNDFGSGGTKGGCPGYNAHADGGAGYGGGGAGYDGGGGGGGYSGGGGGLPATTSNNEPAFLAGGGGGSYVDEIYASASSKSAGGKTSSPEDGEISYNVFMKDAPVAGCMDATIYLDNSGQATLNVTDIDFESSDPDGSIVGYKLSKTDFDCTHVGTSQSVELYITDNEGFRDTCTASVTVLDTISPVAMCRDFTIYLDESGGATLKPSDIDNNSSDYCGIESMEVSPSSFSCEDIGAPVEITLTVTDFGGNVSTCTASVTVLDTISPSAICKNFTIPIGANGEATLAPSDISNSTDNCRIESMEVSPSTFTCKDVGKQVEVTLTVTDLSGNISTCTAQVLVVDDMAPVTACQEIILYLDENGVATLSPSDIDYNSTDNCGIESMEVSPSDFSCMDVGTPVEVTLTTTDFSGNKSTCMVNVTVLDTIAPVALCKNITVYVDESGVAKIGPSDIDNNSTDNCGIGSMEVSPMNVTCMDVSNPVQVTLTVYDDSGNSSSCTSTVTVRDQIAPNARCRDITVYLDDQGEVNLEGIDLDDGSTDNCDVVNFEVSRTRFTCDDLGTNTVELIVSDGTGNKSICYPTVTVKNTILPSVRTKDVTVYLDQNGVASITPEMIDQGSTIGCPKGEMWLEGLVEYDCGTIGVHDVILHIEDKNGNSDSGAAQVTVKYYEPDFENIHGASNGDTIRLLTCQSPGAISGSDLINFDELKQYGRIRVKLYKEDLPEDAPWSMYALWRYLYIFEDGCGRTFQTEFYAGQYDINPPTYQDFPPDITVASMDEISPVSGDVRIIDICQFVAWDTVITFPVIGPVTGDTIGFTRRWMARDPTGHQSYRDQMIWIGTGHRNQYGQITGRLAEQGTVSIQTFSGEAGTNGIPVSLYRIDENGGTRDSIDTWKTGDWMGTQGRYFFEPVAPGKYQVKIDSSICVVDTLKFDEEGWSDTLEVEAGETLDQGLVLFHDCAEVLDRGVMEGMVGLTEPGIGSNSSNDPELSWSVYPNPSIGYLQIAIPRQEILDYQIYNALGRMVQYGVYHPGAAIDVNGLISGIYHLRLMGKGKILGSRKVLLVE